MELERQKPRDVLQQLERLRQEYRIRFFAELEESQWPGRLQHIIAAINNPSTTRFHTYITDPSIIDDAPYKEEVKSRAALLIEKASRCVGQNEDTWRLGCEETIFGRLSLETFCSECDGRIWRSEIEVKRFEDPAAAQALRFRQQQRTVCHCQRESNGAKTQSRKLNTIFGHRENVTVRPEAELTKILPRNLERPDKVFGLRGTGILQNLINHLVPPGQKIIGDLAKEALGPDPLRLPLEQTTNPLWFPFLVMEAKSGKSDRDWHSTHLQTCFAIRTFIESQDRLLLAAGTRSKWLSTPMVWYFSHRGCDWRLSIAFLEPGEPKPHTICNLEMNIIDVWRGSILTSDGALQLLLLVDYIFDWARDVYRPDVITELNTIICKGGDFETVSYSDSGIHSLQLRHTSKQTDESKMPGQNPSISTARMVTATNTIIYSSREEGDSADIPSPGPIVSPSLAQMQFYEWLLASLRFDEINARKNQIDRSFPNSFLWIFGIEDPNTSTIVSDEDNDEWSSDSDNSSCRCDARRRLEEASQKQFVHFLNSDDSLFWISGKPGSGKSTLMKFVVSSPRTQRILASDDEDELHQRLDSLPDDLFTLYRNMWLRSNADHETNWKHAAVLLQLLLLPDSELAGDLILDTYGTGIIRSEISVFYIMVASTDYAMDHGTATGCRLSLDELLACCEKTLTSIHVRCAGLVEVSERYCNLPEGSQISLHHPVFEYFGLTARFIHRTALDFLLDTSEGNSIWAQHSLPPFEIASRFLFARLTACQILSLLPGFTTPIVCNKKIEVLDRSSVGRLLRLLSIVRGRDCCDATPLLLPVLQQYCQNTVLTLDYGTCLSPGIDEGTGFLLLASKFGFKAFVMSQLRQQADATKISRFILMECCGNEFEPVFRFHPGERGRWNIIQELLLSGTPPNQCLCVAPKDGSPNVCTLHTPWTKFLRSVLDFSTVEDLLNECHCSFVHIRDTIHTFIDCGADLNAPTTIAFFWTVSSNGQPGLLIPAFTHFHVNHSMGTLLRRKTRIDCAFNTIVLKIKTATLANSILHLLQSEAAIEDRYSISVGSNIAEVLMFSRPSASGFNIFVPSRDVESSMSMNQVTPWLDRLPPNLWSQEYAILYNTTVSHFNDTIERLLPQTREIHPDDCWGGFDCVGLMTAISSIWAENVLCGDKSHA